MSTKTSKTTTELFAYDQTGNPEDDLLVMGVDEAGRGPWAGPVVAAAVCFPPDVETWRLEGLNDSKQLTPQRREKLAQVIRETALAVGIGQASAEEIDHLNILQATKLAMRRAFIDAGVLPNRVLVDGNQDPGFEIPTDCVVKGDGHSAAIAAASIIAKTHRDRMMELLGGENDCYGFALHKGYGTRHHQHALEVFGPGPQHRQSFRPVARLARHPGPRLLFRQTWETLQRCQQPHQIEQICQQVLGQTTDFSESERYLISQTGQTRLKLLKQYKNKDNHRQQGTIFEKEAMNYLLKQGFDIIERNYRGQSGEIDLIVRDGTTLVFVEVKQRSTASFGMPAEAVDARKQQRLSRCALEYLARFDDLPDCRFDIIAIEGATTDTITVRHFPNAFMPLEEEW